MAVKYSFHLFLNRVIEAYFFNLFTGNRVLETVFVVQDNAYCFTTNTTGRPFFLSYETVFANRTSILCLSDVRLTGCKPRRLVEGISHVFAQQIYSSFRWLMMKGYDPN